MADFNYTLSFAGVSFVEDKSATLRAPREELDEVSDGLRSCPDLLDEINRLMPFRYGKEFFYPNSYLGRNLGALAVSQDPGSDFTPDINIGEWFYPNTAGKWSIFRGLATSSQVKAMLAACGTIVPALPSSTPVVGLDPAQFIMQAAPVNANNPNGDPSLYTLSTSMYMLPPKPLAEHGGQFDGLYLVTLVDERYYFRGSPISLHCHQRSTWYDLLVQLQSALGISINNLVGYSGEPAYTQPEIDSQLWTNFENASTLLDAVAANIGRVVVRELDGTYSLLTAAESRIRVIANRGDAANLLRAAGGDYFSSGTNLPIGQSTLFTAKNAAVPSKVYVTFPAYVVGDDPVPHMLNARYRNQRPSAWYEESYGATYTFAVPITSGGPFVSGIAGVSDVTLRDTAKALFSGEIQYFRSGVIAQGGIEDLISGQIYGRPLNYTGLRSLATQLAADYYSWQVAAALDESYPGTYKWSPEGLHDLVWTYSSKRRLAATRVVKSPWTQNITDFQHATPPLSGFTNTPKGVGGPSVAQTIRDSYTQSGTFVGASGLSGYIQTNLAYDLLSGDSFAVFQDISYLPTQNRWRATVFGSGGTNLSGFSSGQAAVATSEVILFEGTSGGPSSLQLSGNFKVTIAQRGIDGTFAGSGHPTGALVRWNAPDATYGVNLTSYEKMAFAFPNEWTSGGIQGVNIVPQTQTVKALATTGEWKNNVLHYSGILLPYDSAWQSGPWTSGEFVWIIDRNTASQRASGVLASGPLSGGPSFSGTYSGTAYSGQIFISGDYSGYPISGTGNSVLTTAKYDGQLMGFSAWISGRMKAAPIYAIDGPVPAAPGTSLTINEVAGNTLSPIIETINNVATLWVQDGVGPAINPTPHDTGLRVDSVAAGQARAYILPCNYSFSLGSRSGGGAVVPFLNQRLGDGVYKSFTHVSVDPSTNSSVSGFVSGSQYLRPTIDFNDNDTIIGAITHKITTFARDITPSTSYRPLVISAEYQRPTGFSTNLEMGFGDGTFWFYRGAGNSATVPVVRVGEGINIGGPGGFGRTTTFNNMRFAAGWLVEIIPSPGLGFTGLLG